MTDDDLARRAVAAWQKCGLRWLPGMVNAVSEMRVVSTDIEGAEDDAICWSEGGGQHWILISRTTDAVPDLNDHATLGCIEHGMLPDAWADIGDHVRIDVVAADDIDVHDRVIPATCVRVMYWADGWRVFRAFTRRDTAEALVACLEAAAERREP